MKKYLEGKDKISNIFTNLIIIGVIWNLIWNFIVTLANFSPEEVQSSL